MATIDLGKVRETVTGTVLKSGSTSSGSTAKWAITTDLQPNGVGEFSVYNGRDGADGNTTTFCAYVPRADLIDTIKAKVSNVNQIICFFGYTVSGGVPVAKQYQASFEFIGGGAPSGDTSAINSVSLYNGSGTEDSPSNVGFIYYKNDGLTPEPADGSVTTAKLADEAVTNAKIKVVEVSPPRDTLANFLAFFYNLYNNHPEARIKFHNNAKDHYYPLLFRADITDDTIEFIKIFPNTFDSISSVILDNNGIISVTGGQDFDNYVQNFADYITVLKYAD